MLSRGAVCDVAASCVVEAAMATQSASSRIQPPRDMKSNLRSLATSGAGTLALRTRAVL